MIPFNFNYIIFDGILHDSLQIQPSPIFMVKSHEPTILYHFLIIFPSFFTCHGKNISASHGCPSGARSLPIRVITWITWRWSRTSRRCQWEFFVGRSIGQVGGHITPMWGWVKTLVLLVNIKIAGKWMFIPLKMVLIGFDPYPCHYGK